MKGVYLITCIPTGEHYVGCSEHMGIRWKKHLSQLARGAHHCLNLQDRHNSYGVEAFTFQVLQAFHMRQEVNLLVEEEKWILDVQPTLNTYTPWSRLGKRGRHVKQNENGSHSEPEQPREMLRGCEGMRDVKRMLRKG